MSTYKAVFISNEALASFFQDEQENENEIEMMKR